MKRIIGIMLITAALAGCVRQPLQQYQCPALLDVHYPNFYAGFASAATESFYACQMANTNYEPHQPFMVGPTDEELAQGRQDLQFQLNLWRGIQSRQITAAAAAQSWTQYVSQQQYQRAMVNEARRQSQAAEAEADSVEDIAVSNSDNGHHGHDDNNRPSPPASHDASDNNQKAQQILNQSPFGK